jgi:phage shock protein C
MLFGVAGGLARYLDLDPSLVRIVWALLVFAGGAGILLYIVAAIVIPEEPLSGVAPTSAAAVGSTPGIASSDPTAEPGQAPDGGHAWGYQAGIERRERGGGVVLIGVVLVVIGAWLLLQRFVPQIDAALVWPVVLLLLGGALVLGALRR